MMIMLLFASAAAAATALHWSEPNPHMLDLVIPPTIFSSYIILLVWLYRRPHAYKQVFWISLTVSMFAIGIPIWTCIIRASLGLDLPLVDNLPPIVSFPIAFTIGIAIFATPRTALVVGLLSWLLISLPLLLYLFLHPLEMWSPRGKEIIITLGPVMALITILIPIHRELETKLSQALFEKSAIQDMSERDTLTNLFNRRVAERHIQACIDDKSSTNGIILFDIDNFKSVNDTYGHLEGDTVLVEVANRCRSILRHDDRLARWGGEEFLVVMNNVDVNSIRSIAEDLRLIISSSPIEPVGLVSASFGGSIIAADDTSESILKRVDKAMYSAKHNGRNQVTVVTHS